MKLLRELEVIVKMIFWGISDKIRDMLNKPITTLIEKENIPFRPSDVSLP